MSFDKIFDLTAGVYLNFYNSRGGYVALPPFGHFFFSGSVLLARVTSLFLAVTG